MGQNNKKPTGHGGLNGVNGVHMNGSMHSTNASTNGEPHPEQHGFQFEENSQSNMIYSSDSGKVTLDDFELLKVIGQGNFAKVMQVR